MDDRKRLVEKIRSEKLTVETMAMRIAREFNDGDYVKPRPGIPAWRRLRRPVDNTSSTMPSLGVLGYGTAIEIDEWESIDMNMYDAAIRHVREKPGMVMFDMNEAFNMLRGKHLAAAVVGGFQVSQKGDFANWAFEYPVPNSGISIGGGFDLVVGPRRCIVALTHLDKQGNPKVLKELTLPLTGAPQQVDLVITALAVIEIKGPKGKKKAMKLLEIAPGWTVEEIQALTEAEMEIPADVPGHFSLETESHRKGNNEREGKGKAFPFPSSP